MSERWPIERHWGIVLPKGEFREVTNEGLNDFRACGLLGAAGLGKSYELMSMAEAAKRQGKHVEFWRLAHLGLSQESLQSQLDRIAARASEETLILLDALDEVMIPIRTAAYTIERWIIESLCEKKPELRIACRSAVWPPEIGAALRKVYGTDVCATAQLQALNNRDIEKIAANNGLDASAFIAQVKIVNATSLSQQPLTLEMLMKIFRDSGTLPDNREQLFRDGVEKLASERVERLRIRTASETPTPILLEASERLACVSLLSGRNVVDLNDAPADSALGRQELERLPGEPALSFDVLEDVGRCGLCESESPLQFRFGHRQLSEYLAGRRIAKLLPHQARSLLSSGGDWQAGVAGPLRETAAFAAMASPAIAAWVTESDPEVIGLSDVASEELRKRATAKMLEKFRRHELTDSQVRRSATEFLGFKYAGAESDLRDVLRERHVGCEDVLEFVIELIESWGLTDLCDDLAMLMLDSTAPIESRKSAGYLLLRNGSPEVYRRLLPLIEGVPEDTNYDLKGLALRCNWPVNLAVAELLRVLTPAPPDNYHGSYDGFLSDLEEDGFDARDDIVGGLVWAKQFVSRESAFRYGRKIAHRIAIASLARLNEPGVTDALAELLICSESAHGCSPLAFDRSDNESKSAEPTLANLPNERRELLTAIAAKLGENGSVWMIVHDTPGLLNGADFRWLLAKAVDDGIPMPQREQFAQFARMLPWDEPVTDFEAWFAIREIEPIATYFRSPLAMELGSKEAEQARKVYLLSQRRERKPKQKRLQPSPSERVAQVLSSCETKDTRYFAALCEELTLEEFSTQYDFERFLTRSPGWTSAVEATRTRILAAAKHYLLADLEDPDAAKSVPLSRILHGPMQAIWLLQVCDLPFLESLPPTWWSKWAWYILRELHLNMMDESEESKHSLLALLYRKDANSVRCELERLAQSDEERTKQLLADLLDAFTSIDDATLDADFCKLLAEGKVVPDRISDVAQFVLMRKHAASLSTCLNLVKPIARAQSDEVLIEVLDALLQQRIGESWSKVFECLTSRPDLARKVLETFAAGHRLNRTNERSSFLAEMTFAQVGELASLLIKTFPIEDDDRNKWTHAERLRNQLINWLGEQRHFGAVEALRKMEQELGARYSWIKRPRAEAERNYRLSIWNPIPPEVVAEILAADKKQLIRSPIEAADGVVAAIEAFGNSLRHESPNALDDLWELPSKGRAKPRPEERISEKVCSAVRAYFKRFALTADREVQVFRRKQPVAQRGAPGSEADVLCRVPAIGTSDGDPIAVPIEVKLAHNAEARTGLKEQLWERYMSELGTNVGVFVVVWMGNIRAPYKPLWKSVEDAQRELEAIASGLQSAEKTRRVRIVVVDSSLPSAKPAKSKRRRSPTAQRKKAPANSEAPSRKSAKKGQTQKTTVRPTKRLARKADSNVEKPQKRVSRKSEPQPNPPKPRKRRKT